MTTTSDLMPMPMLALHNAAPAIVDAVRLWFDARPLEATPITISARFDIDTYYSTPELALIIEAADPTGFTDYDAVVSVTGRSPSGLAVRCGSSQNQMVDDAELVDVAAFVAGVLTERVPA